MSSKQQLVLYIVFGLPESTKTGGCSSQSWLARRLLEKGIDVEIFIADQHDKAFNVVKILVSRQPGLCLIDGIAIYWVGHQGLRVVKEHHFLSLILHYPFSTEPYRNESWLKDAIPPDCVNLREYEKSLIRLSESLLVFGEKCAEILKTPEFGFEDVPTNVLIPPVQIWARRIACKSPGANPTFVSVGTLSKRKNQLILIRALSQLVSEKWLRKPRLLLIGSIEMEPAYTAEVRALARKFPDVDIEITGPLTIQETHRRIAQSHCALFPSEFESFGMAAVEAACIGIPIISSTEAAPRDMLPESTLWVDSSKTSDEELNAWVRALQLWTKTRANREILAFEKAQLVLEQQNPEYCLKRWLSTWRSESGEFDCFDMQDRGTKGCCLATINKCFRAL